MKKANVVVCYECGNDVSVKNVIFMYRGGHVAFPCLARKSYDGLSGAYGDVLALAKNNDFRVPYYEEFGVRWYDILWVDCSTGAVAKYPA